MKVLRAQSFLRQSSFLPDKAPRMNQVATALLLACCSTASEGQPVPPALPVETSTNTWYFAATATDNNGLTSDYSNEVSVTNIFSTNPPIASVVLAWDRSPGTNVITNYTAASGSSSGKYTNFVPVGTNLTATVVVIPPAKPRIVVVQISTTGTNLYGSSVPQGPWSSLGTTNFVATNLAGPIYFRGKGNGVNTVDIKQTTQ